MVSPANYPPNSRLPHRQWAFSLENRALRSEDPISRLAGADQLAASRSLPLSCLQCSDAHCSLLVTRSPPAPRAVLRCRRGRVEPGRAAPNHSVPDARLRLPSGAPREGKEGREGLRLPAHLLLRGPGGGEAGGNRHPAPADRAHRTGTPSGSDQSHTQVRWEPRWLLPRPGHPGRRPLGSRALRSHGPRKMTAPDPGRTRLAASFLCCVVVPGRLGWHGAGGGGTRSTALSSSDDGRPAQCTPYHEITDCGHWQS